MRFRPARFLAPAQAPFGRPSGQPAWVRNPSGSTSLLGPAKDLERTVVSLLKQLGELEGLLPPGEEPSPEVLNAASEILEEIQESYRSTFESPGRGQESLYAQLLHAFEHINSGDLSEDGTPTLWDPSDWASVVLAFDRVERGLQSIEARLPGVIVRLGASVKATTPADELIRGLELQRVLSEQSTERFQERSGQTTPTTSFSPTARKEKVQLYADQIQKWLNNRKLYRVISGSPVYSEKFWTNIQEMLIGAVDPGSDLHADALEIAQAIATTLAPEIHLGYLDPTTGEISEHPFLTPQQVMVIEEALNSPGATKAALVELAAAVTSASTNHAALRTPHPAGASREERRGGGKRAGKGTSSQGGEDFFQRQGDLSQSALEEIASEILSRRRGEKEALQALTESPNMHELETSQEVMEELRRAQVRGRTNGGIDDSENFRRHPNSKSAQREYITDDIIVAYIRQGYSQRQVAEELNVTRWRVRKAVANRGINYVPPVAYELVADLWAQGYTVAEISEIAKADSRLIEMMLEQLRKMDKLMTRVVKTLPMKQGRPESSTTDGLNRRNFARERGNSSRFVPPDKRNMRS